jgi:hypothetical protein
MAGSGFVILVIPWIVYDREAMFCEQAIELAAIAVQDLGAQARRYLALLVQMSQGVDHDLMGEPISVFPGSNQQFLGKYDADTHFTVLRIASLDYTAT